MIKRATIDQVKDLPVKDVLESYGLAFRREGAYFKTCCPLHGERTPSFVVNTSRNSWKCFGCGEGGSGIDFVMKRDNLTFAEAVIAIAKAHNIEVKYDRRERTAEELEAHNRKMSMLNAIAKTQEFYEQQFRADSDEAQQARDYAYARWGEEFCRESGIGYAPTSGAAVIEFLRGCGFSEDILIEAGILGRSETNGRLYAQLRSRVTIPIRDRYNRVVAFTARYFGHDGSQPKYKNSRTSEAFKKSETLFGIDTATSQARKSGFFIIVEGAPDVLRLQSIGLTQAVATLGTALTEHHLDSLRSTAKTVKFIPDSDPPKEGALYGAGVQSVMKNGRLAMEKGFEVAVREIPRSKDDDAYGVKHDADSFITSTDIYNSLEDVPFVQWYAAKRFAGADSPAEQKSVMQDVAYLLILMEDRLMQGLSIDGLCKIFGKQKMWHEAMHIEARKLRNRANSPDIPDGFSSREVEVLRSLGIIIKDGCYLSTDSDENLVRWSNFIFRPVLHIKDPARSTRILRMINQDGDEEVIELSSSDLVSLRDFRRKLIDKGNFVWRSEQSNSLTAIGEYLFAITTSAVKVDTIGWNSKDEYYALADGLYIGNSYVKADRLGTVQYGTRRYFLPAFSELYLDKDGDFSFERLFRHSGQSRLTMHDFAEQLAKVYGDGAKVGLAWVFAAVFRDVVFEKLRSFPMLNLFGRKGSGKTELAKALASLFYVIKNTPSSCSNTSIPALAYMLSHARNAVVILDEFTNDLRPERIDIIKGIWGGTSQSKMNMEDKRPITIPVYSGVILGGQYKPDDEAIFSRCIHLQYAKTSFSEQEGREFDRLQAMTLPGNSHLLMQLLGLRSIFEHGFIKAYDLTVADVAEKIRGAGIEDRIRKNWIVPLAAFRVLEPHLDLPFSYNELFEIVVAGMKFQNDQITKSSETADFWLFLDSLHTAGKVKERCHYVIKTVNSFTASGDTEKRSFIHPKRVLYLNFKAVRSLLEARMSKPKTGNSVSIETLESYLKTLPQYMGRKYQRFQFMRANGELDVEYRSEGGQQRKYVNGNTQKAMCFDYDALKDTLDLSLESLIFTEAETLAPDDEEVNHPQSGPAAQQPQINSLFQN